MSLTEQGEGDGCKVRVSLSCFAYAKTFKQNFLHESCLFNTLTLRNLVRAITIQSDSADVATNIYQCVLLFIKVSYFLEFNTFHEFNFL